MLLWVRSAPEEREAEPGSAAGRVPAAGVAILVRTAMEAATLAQNGRFAAGYRRLSDGLRQVERLRPSGLPWVEELVRLYQQALQGYCACCGVRLD